MSEILHKDIWNDKKMSEIRAFIDDQIKIKNKKMKIKLIDFWAEWCRPCKILSPVIDELKTEYAGNENVEIEKINVDEDAEASIKYGIRSIPTLILLNAETGDVLDKKVGAITKAKLVEWIDKKLESN